MHSVQSHQPDSQQLSTDAFGHAEGWNQGEQFVRAAKREPNNLRRNARHAGPMRVCTHGLLGFVHGTQPCCAVSLSPTSNSPAAQQIRSPMLRC